MTVVYTSTKPRKFNGVCNGANAAKSELNQNQNNQPNHEHTDTDQALVDEVLPAEADRARDRRSGRIKEGRSVVGCVERADGGGEEEGASEGTHVGVR